MSLIAAAQITAVATVVLALFAIVTAGFAILAFRKQSAEVATLQQQFDDQRKVNDLQARELQESLDERKREADERRSAQATLVFVWEERATHAELGKPQADIVTAHVHNTSEQPVYNLKFSWRSNGVLVHQTRRETQLMPGEQDQDPAQVPAGADSDTFGPVILFRDRAGLWWRARPDGKLDYLPPGEEPPHSW